MDEFRNHKIIKKERGQSVVEYILLLAVLSALGITLLNSKKMKDFLAGKDGIFKTMKKGLAYSYRYGRDLPTAKDPDQKLTFEYTNTKHDLYMGDDGKTHFFLPYKKYPR